MLYNARRIMAKKWGLYMKKDVYNLSKPQESIWLTEQYFKNTNINRLVTLADFSKKLDNLDFDILNKAINNVVKYNDNFQIRLFLENGEIKQYFCDYQKFDCEVVTITSLDDFLEEDSRRKNVFDLFGGPLFEFRLFKFKGTNTGGILANFHHIICDGFSAALCVRQIFESYDALIKNKELPNLNPNNYSYKQYLASEKEYLESNKFIKDKTYWSEVFQTVPEVVSIYSNKNTSHNFNPEANRETYIINASIMNKIKTLCEEIKISPYNFFMSIFGIYISKASRLDDFAVGTPILNRSNFREKNTLGMYVSTVPFRITLENTLSFSNFVSKIAKDTMSMLRHQKYSYGYIIEELRKKSSSVPNLYNILFSYQISNASDESQDYRADWLSNHCISGDLDINMYDLNSNGSVTVSYDYNVNKYAKEDILAMHNRILNVVNQVLENKDVLVKDIDIATAEEKLQILTEFNNTKTDYPKDKSVIELFEEQVNLSPNAPAVYFEGKTLTYRELNEKANSLANCLKAQGVMPHDVVALFLDKSFEAIISMIATLKLGAAYLPIDISYPTHRISYMLKDANAKAFLVTSNLDFKLTISIPKVIVDLDSFLYAKDTEFVSAKVLPTDLVYVIYTSGSTGTPKGVMVPNSGVVRLTKSPPDYITFNQGDKLLQTVSISFDVSIFEIWGSLLNGLELFLLRKTDLLNPKYFASFLKEKDINCLFLSTAVFNKFCEEDPKMFSNLKYLVVGGEALSYKHTKIAREANPNLTMVNGYGPTENSTFSTYYNIKDTSMGFIPIRLSNLKFYLFCSIYFWYSSTCWNPWRTLGRRRSVLHLDT